MTSQSSEVTSESPSASPTPSITKDPEDVGPEFSDEDYLGRENPFVTFYNQTKSMILDQEIPGTEDMLKVTINPSILTAGASFTAKIQGIPGEEVHFWIIIPENMTNSGNSSLPYVSPEQKELTFDDAAGPYKIGAFVPDEKERNLTIREIIPIDQDHKGTQFYGLARLDKTGTATVVWDTTGATQGEYFIRVESEGSNTDYEVTIRKAAASIEVR
ncbi:MAG: hypothetical protein CVV33_10010 [Methanomicrobiales archaeon HGW-Methanomicrobiales-4]|nr:MAG: hypothetical protein CVV33_10010 [Methanomicrobiales archaeon HGW-Methanomicrobiales-4]